MIRWRTVIVWLVERSTWAVDRTASIARGMVQGFWLGVLDAQTLRLLSQRYYLGRGTISEGRYVERAYNRSGLFDWERSAVATCFKPSCRIVVTAAGAGRELLDLLDDGFDAVGFEPSEELVRLGRALLIEQGRDQNRLQPCEPDSWPDRAPLCDAVIVGWGSYSLIAGRTARVEFLRRAHAMLPRDGCVLLSFLALAGTTVGLRTVAATANVVRSVTGRPRVELGDALHGHFVHGFTREQFEEEIVASGFELVHYAADPYAHAVVRAIERP